MWFITKVIFPFPNNIFSSVTLWALRGRDFGPRGRVYTCVTSHLFILGITWVLPMTDRICHESIGAAMQSNLRSISAMFI